MSYFKIRVGKRRQRKHERQGRRRNLTIRLSLEIHAMLEAYAEARDLNMSQVVEEALQRFLSKFAASRNPVIFIDKLKEAQNLLREIIALAGVQKFGLQEQKGVPLDIKEERQRRRTVLSDKCLAAFDYWYEIANSKQLTEEDEARGVTFAILARLASVNALILRDAANEHIFEEMQKIREEEQRFEEFTREFEARAQEKPAAGSERA